MGEFQQYPWDRPASETIGNVSAFSLLPEDFFSMGSPGRPEHVFSQLQNPRFWIGGQPNLAKKTMVWLRELCDLRLPAILEKHISEDGSTKLVLCLSDGERIEAVHMPRTLIKRGTACSQGSLRPPFNPHVTSRPSQDDTSAIKDHRVTLCISSQVGCAMGCTFCATHKMGIRRNLSAGEIVGQVIALLLELGPLETHRITLVFMGMGEPLHNLENVCRAVKIFNHEQGLNISTKRITISTSGLVPGIEKLALMQPRPWLAISLNATTDEVRNGIMPVNRAWNLSKLREALEKWSVTRKEKLTIEYVLLEGINDTPEDAERLAAWMGDLRVNHNLNLIKMNKHPSTEFKEPGVDRINAFVATLKSNGCFVTVRKSRGRDIQGACGQLINTKK